MALGADRRWSNSVDEHAGILAALEARDSEAAGRLLDIEANDFVCLLGPSGWTCGQILRQNLCSR
ncbi:hypothetical protein [Bradyrhizobium daqingense]|uniref:hypothetical protein n=1 Tax=Bradyrhizobium daqingense TaxID=993502 RepID=UPI00384BCEA8